MAGGSMDHGWVTTAPENVLGSSKLTAAPANGAGAESSRPAASDNAIVIFSGVWGRPLRGRGHDPEVEFRTLIVPTSLVITGIHRCMHCRMHGMLHSTTTNPFCHAEILNPAVGCCNARAAGALSAANRWYIATR